MPEMDDTSVWKAGYIHVKEKSVKQIYFTPSMKRWSQLASCLTVLNGFRGIATVENLKEGSETG